MTTKLTLSVEEKVIDRAKKYAKAQGRSLSSLVENYLNSISTPKKQVSSPIVERLRGSVKLPADFDYKKELRKALIEKNVK